MKRIIKSTAIGVILALSILWACPNPLMAQSVLQGIGSHRFVTSISVVTGGADTWGSSNVVVAGGACGGRLSTQSKKSAIAPVPAGVPFMVWVGCDKGLAADADSCIIVVESRPDGVTNGPTANRSWFSLGCTSTNADSTDYPITFMFRSDYDSLYTPTAAQLTSVDGGGILRFSAVSLGNVRVSLSGPNADSTADAVGRWPIVITW